MGAVLGVAVGTTNSGTALVTADGTATDGTDVVTSTRPTILHLLPDGTAAFPEADDDAGRAALTGFVERVGDPVGLLDDAGRIHAGADLFAAAVAGLVDSATPATVVVTHPTTWSRYTVRALETALARAGLPAAGTTTEAAACVRWLESSRGYLDDGVVVVYDLGASGLDVTVARTGSEPVILGKPLRSEDFGGAHFDQLITRYVLDAIADKVTDLDPFDAPTTAALAVLRADCAAAKERLSTDTETAIPVALPGVTTDVRLVRSELEDLIRRPLSGSVDLIREALRSAEIEISDVTHVLLAGGGGAIPLVAEVVSSELGLTVVAAPVPALTAAIGAAYLAGDAPTADTAAAPDPIEPEHDTADGVYRAPVTASFPSRLHTPDRSSTRRRISIIAAAVAAAGLLTAGGLSIGTAAHTSPSPAATSTSDTSAPAPTEGGALTADGAGTSGSSSPEMSAVNVTVDGRSTAATAIVGTNRSGGRTDATGGQSSPLPPAPGGAPAATPGTPAPENPGTAAASSPTPEAPPAPAPGATPANPGINGPSPREVGEGFAKAANGIGQGLGAAATGIGTGVGGIVGAVVDPLTGVLIGK